MFENRATKLTRRSLLRGAAGLTMAGLLPHNVFAATDLKLIARAAKLPLVGGHTPETAVWAYNSAVPGPELRVRQGDRVRIAVENQLAEETTVHFHGIRLPNAMDGVPHLTQHPIAPGGAFLYDFVVPDAGTYWYHPHQRSFEQMGRGLSGAFIVEERTPLVVDRDIVWVLSDWRLLPDAQISGDFRSLRDMSHNGRIGNTVTINGKVPETFAVRSGERIRLRLINAANARIFGLNFSGHQPMVIAYDGQPVAPHAPADGSVVLGPAMRIDLIVDMTGKPGQTFQIVDSFYRNLAYRLVDLAYASEPLRDRPLDGAIVLPANTMPEPDIANAERHEVTFNGGMMGQMMMRDPGRMGGMNMMEMMRSGKIWFVNGKAVVGHVMEPMLALKRGRSCVLAMNNETAWHHPMHLHGHSFRVISRNGAPTQHREWQDTVLMAPRERVEIAFVADNPGDWMFHCHILEHQESGMMGVIRIA
ncbi:MAG: multicopper oxidase family protein [Hyphomicrobiaceae bacterium]|nr:MAG: multicopper oxidase family protein [Hyphomicrobiaceae bacterium]